MYLHLHFKDIRWLYSTLWSPSFQSQETTSALSSKPSPGHLQRPLKPTRDARNQRGRKSLHGGKLHNLPGQPVPVLSHPHSKITFPGVQTECPVFSFVPTASRPEASWKTQLCPQGLPCCFLGHWANAPSTCDIKRKDCMKHDEIEKTVQ